MTEPSRRRRLLSGRRLVRSTVADGPPYLRTPTFTFRSDGSALMTVNGGSFEGASCVERHADPSYVATRRPDGSLTPLVRLDGRLRSRPVLAAAGGAVAVLTEPQPGSTDCEPTDRMILADLSADGDVSARHELVPRVDLWDVGVAEGGGTVAVLWIEAAEETTSTLRMAVRAADGTLSAPVTLDRGDGVIPQGPWISDADVDVTPSGDVLVVYALPREIRAVTIDRTGRVVRRETLGRTQSITRVVADVAAGGRAAVAWSTQDGGEEREQPYRVFAVTRAPGSLQFRRRQTLDHGGLVETGSGTLALSLAADGRALLAWDQLSADHRRGSFVRVAAASPAGAFGRPQVVARRRTLSDAAIAPDGRVTLVTGDEDGRLVVLRRSGLSRRFGRPQRLPGWPLYEASVTFSPTGEELLGWPAGRKGNQHVVVASRR